MRVLITGADGFIGSNLQAFLKTSSNSYEIDKYTLDNTEEELAEKISKADFIVHLAGVNRPQTPDEFYSGNSDLTKTIVDILVKNKLSTPLIFSSSIQAELDNDYGKSKRLAEDYIFDNYKYGIVFRLHNVFGKGCRPNYNSVVATFCNNIAHDQDITISDPKKQLELIYIDDICKTFISIIEGHTKPSEKYNYVSPTYKITLQGLADTIKRFKEDLCSVDVPKTGDDFTKKLFSTYISYNGINQLTYEAFKNTDDRGSFTELLHTSESGQFSVSISKPGITRGNHYHHTKVEKFIVLFGEADLRLRKINEDKIHTIHLSGDTATIVTIPVGYTHNITNTGKTEMVLGIWCNELFDKNNPDTYYMEV